uniref:Phosphatidylinositol-glycan biosynthesis class W protein n=1 Tax=Elaeophora elaphi TaxID=1147741 RepID=A0A0R3RS13_9BILA
MHLTQNARIEDPNSIYNGTSQTELILWQLIGPFSILLRNTAVPWIFVGFRFALKFALDFLFIVLPIILSLTLFSDHLSVILLLQLVALLSLITFSLCEYCFIARDKPTLREIFGHMVDDQHSPTKFITYMRSMGLIATAVAILSVDFDIFPRRFAKTHTYGRSVMDLGTAASVYCFAVVDVFKDFPSRSKFPPLQKKNFFWKHLPRIMLLCLGFGRTCVVQLLNYPIQVAEYGVHWNFFLTLALLRIIVKLLGRRFHLLFGIIIISVYQYLLSERNLQNWLLSEDVKRDTFIAMNREGIFSLLGYLSIYYFASAIASFMCSTGIRLKSWFYRTFQLFMIAVFLFFAQKLAEMLMGPPSRRIANLSYILEMLVFHTVFMASLLLIQLASIFGWAAQMPQFSIDENPFERLKPCMLDSVNRYGLPFFLLTNILTGLINLAITTSSVTNIYHSTTIIIIYMFISCAIIHVYTRLKQTS